MAVKGYDFAAEPSDILPDFVRGPRCKQANDEADFIGNHSAFSSTRRQNCEYAAA